MEAPKPTMTQGQHRANFDVPADGSDLIDLESTTLTYTADFGNEKEQQ